MPHDPSWKKLALFRIVAAMLGLVIVFAAAELATRYHLGRIKRSNRIDPGHMQYDRQLGWRLTPDWRGRHRHYDYDAAYSTNRYGFRGVFREPKEGGVRRFAVVGDSFTFGYGVNDDQTFVALLNRRSGKRGVFYNFGVPGYSTDQEYLLIKQRVFLFRPDVVVLVVYLFNDLIDNMLPYPFQARRAKPYFVPSAGALQLKNVPVPRRAQPAAAAVPDRLRRIMGRPGTGGVAGFSAKSQLMELIGVNDLLFKPPLPDLDAVLQPAKHLFLAIIDLLHDACRSRGIRLRIIALPGRSYVTRPDSRSAKMQENLRSWLVDEMVRRGLTVCDLAEGLRERRADGNDRLFYPNEGHLTPMGNEAAADILHNSLFLPRRPEKQRRT